MNLQPIKLDNWLFDLGNLDEAHLLIRNILEGSLFYPASGVDSDPVTYLNRYTTSFVYCDYGIEEERVDEQRMMGWFDGYHVIHQRTLLQDEIAPDGFRMPALSESDPDPETSAADRKREFYLWFVFERDTISLSADSPRRFSLLYLCVDGIAAFHSLYVARRLSPAAIAIIQPGHHMGGLNYTNFEDPKGVLARMIRRKGVDAPAILMFGGNQAESHYAKACWPLFNEPVARLKRSQPGHLGIWRRRSR